MSGSALPGKLVFGDLPLPPVGAGLDPPVGNVKKSGSGRVKTRPYERCGDFLELDQDLLSQQQARDLARQAGEAQKILAQFSQEKLDAIVEAVGEAFSKEAVSLAEMAVQETGFGNIRDKTAKNRFAADTVRQAVRDMKTVGILSRNPEKDVSLKCLCDHLFQ